MIFYVISSEDVICTEEEFAVDIVLNSNTGAANFGITVAFDSNVLTPVAKDGEWAVWNYDVLGEASSARQFATNRNEDTPDEIYLAYISVDGNSVASGTVATLYFKLNSACLENVASATSAITVFTDDAAYEDASSKYGVSYPSDITFVNDSVTAYHAITVEYVTNDGVIHTVVVPNTGDEVIIPDAPEDPKEFNYAFIGWQDEVVDANSIQMTPIFGYVIEVNGGTIDASTVKSEDHWLEKYTKAYFNTRSEYHEEAILGYDAYATIVADEASEGQVFAYWQDQNGNIVSYESTYHFFVPGNLTFTAVYADEAPAHTPSVSMQIVRGVYDAENNYGAITWVASLNRGNTERYSVIDCGIIYGPGENQDALVKEDPNLSRRISVAAVSAGSAQYSVKVEQVANGATRSAIAYATYKDYETGETFTIYSSSMLSMTMSEDI